MGRGVAGDAEWRGGWMMVDEVNGARRAGLMAENDWLEGELNK